MNMNITTVMKKEGEEFHLPFPCSLIALATVVERQEMQDISIEDGCKRIINHAKAFDRLECYVHDSEGKLMGISFFSVMNDPHYGRVVGHTVFNNLGIPSLKVVKAMYTEGLNYAREMEVNWVARSKRLSSHQYLSHYTYVGDLI